MPIIVDCSVNASNAASTLTLSVELAIALQQCGFVTQAKVLTDAQAVDVRTDRVECETGARFDHLGAKERFAGCGDELAQRQAINGGAGLLVGFRDAQQVLPQNLLQ